MVRRMILIPPSEGKALGGGDAPWGGDSVTPSLAAHRRQVIAALSSALNDRTRDAAALAKLHAAQGETLERAVGANRSIDSAPTMRAIERYDGVLYQYLDAGSLDGRARRRLSTSVRTVSGLWGLVGPDEPIPDYRLKMSASLPGLGKLSSWWRDALSAEVAEQSRGRELWNLLPQEHAAAVVDPARKVVTTAVFLEPDRSGTLVPVSHWNKALKGALVAHLVSTPSATIDDLVEWDHPAGFRLDPASIAAIERRRSLRFVKSD